MTNRSRIALTVLFALALAATPLLAVDTREVNFSQDILIGGQAIQKGWYDLQWKDKGGGAVEVRVIRGGKVLATATGRIIETSSRPESDRVLYKTEGGKRTLAEIHTAGSTQVVKIDG
jgi:hypothetical protein